MSIDLGTPGGLLHDPGYPGMIADMNIPTIESKTNEGATAIDFGRIVARGTTADDTCKAPAADADQLIGIAVRYPIRPANASDIVLYNQFDTVPILKQGYIWVLAAEAVTRGDAVLSLTAGGGTIGGTTGGAAGAGRVALPNAKWETTTASGALGMVRITQ
jgi:hypothetical protein